MAKYLNLAMNIRLYAGHDPGPDAPWLSTTLYWFLRDNPFLDRKERAELREALADGVDWRTGGGAVAAFTVRAE